MKSYEDVFSIYSTQFININKNAIFIIIHGGVRISICYPAALEILIHKWEYVIHWLSKTSF